VLSKDGVDADVWCRRLTLRGRTLELSPPTVTRVQVWVDGYAAAGDLATGDCVAIHWGRVCGRLEPKQVESLEASTVRQLEITNRRLSGGRR
jgi:hypothetical protein